MDSKGIIAQPLEKAGIGKYIAEYILLVGDIARRQHIRCHTRQYLKFRTDCPAAECAGNHRPAGVVFRNPMIIFQRIFGKLHIL